MKPAHYLAALPMFAGRGEDEFQVSPLPGLTNHSYRVDIGGASYVLRCAGAGTAAYLDRRAGLHNARLAAQLELAPELLWHDPQAATTLHCFIPDATSLSQDDFLQPGALDESVDLLRTLHTSGCSFRGQLQPLAAFDAYLGRAPERLRAPLIERRGEVESLASAAGENASPLHVDPVPQNFLRDGRRLWLVDWEYSAMGNPLWDLACLALEAGLDTARCRELLARYYPALDAETEASLERWKRLVSLVALAWYAMQAGLRADSAGYARAFEQRLLTLGTRPSL